MLTRLHKILARAGVAALRPAEDLILEGRVTVNGKVVRELGARADAETDVIAVDGNIIEVPAEAEPHRYLMLHKPAGVISTAHDTHDRPTVVQLVPGDVRVFPVGRLDADSEGLMLLTDDGDLAYRLTHPRFEVDKEYRVLVNRTPDVAELRRWRSGVELPDGYVTGRAWVEVLERGYEGSMLRVVMHEGHKRQIREIARVLDLEVLRLIRVREGPLQLGDLPAGSWRELTQAEVEALRVHTQHIPPRIADEEREHRMADEEQEPRRRIRVIRGPRRTARGPFEQEPGDPAALDARAGSGDWPDDEAGGPPSAPRSAESAPRGERAERGNELPPADRLPRGRFGRGAESGGEYRPDTGNRRPSGGRDDWGGGDRGRDRGGNEGPRRGPPPDRGFGRGSAPSGPRGETRGPGGDRRGAGGGPQDRGFGGDRGGPRDRGFGRDRGGYRDAPNRDQGGFRGREESGPRRPGPGMNRYSGDRDRAGGQGGRGGPPGRGYGGGQGSGGGRSYRDDDRGRRFDDDPNSRGNYRDDRGSGDAERRPGGGFGRGGGNQNRGYGPGAPRGSGGPGGNRDARRQGPDSREGGIRGGLGGGRSGGSGPRRDPREGGLRGGLGGGRSSGSGPRPGSPRRDWGNEGGGFRPGRPQEGGPRRGSDRDRGFGGGASGPNRGRPPGRSSGPGDRGGPSGNRGFGDRGGNSGFGGRGGPSGSRGFGDRSGPSGNRGFGSRGPRPEGGADRPPRGDRPPRDDNDE